MMIAIKQTICFFDEEEDEVRDFQERFRGNFISENSKRSLVVYRLISSLSALEFSVQIEG